MRRKVVIGIHGMGNKPPRDVLKQWWVNSLNENRERNGFPSHTFRFELVYWAHHLHPRPHDLRIVDENDPLFLSEPYVPSAGKPVPKPSRLRRKTLGYIEKILDKLLLNDDLTINYKSFTDSIIRKHFKDLDTYYSADCVGEEHRDMPVRDVIRADLLRVLRRFRRYDILLIAHSMGTIVAYDVLSGNADDVNIHTFVTMGSPLGLPVMISQAVQEQRESDQDIKIATTPPNVQRNWHNLSDLEDRIALNYDLGDDYAPNARGVAAQDHTVYNDYEVSGNSNHHKIYGYLRAKEMSAILHEFLTEDRSPRWLMINDRLQRFWGRIKSCFCRPTKASTQLGALERKGEQQ